MRMDGCDSVMVKPGECLNVYYKCIQGEDAYDILVEMLRKKSGELSDYELVLVAPEKMYAYKIFLALLHTLDAHTLGKRRAKAVEFEVLMRIYGERQISSLTRRMREVSRQKNYACLHLVTRGTCCRGEQEKNCEPSICTKIVEAHLDLTS